ncbi:MAG: hypothetical protein A3J40_08635 [Erythrobacter sp. RIFCSPHIGHO2_12_FULL_63_10]|nr:MAG: hypothetical protein A3J40_08635 [Erythrobacter sp. RIFCSPHIGHO2_12_FULL_63_10]
MTNLLTIALVAWAMARLYGFRTSLTERQSLFQNLVVVSAFVALAVPLFFSLQKIAWETNAQRVVRSELTDAFGDRSRISQVDFDWTADPIAVEATVFTPQLLAEADRMVREAVTRRLGRPIDIALTQYQVGTSASAAEQAQLTSARAHAEAAAAQQAEELAHRLALVAGVAEDNVLVDRQRRRALVRADSLPGASLASYRELEQRVSATEPQWRVQLIPPLGELPDIEFSGEEPSEAGMRALELAAWASERLDLPVELVGNRIEAQRAAEILAENGVNAAIAAGRGPLQARWSVAAE